MLVNGLEQRTNKVTAKSMLDIIIVIIITSTLLASVIASPWGAVNLSFKD